MMTQYPEDCESILQELIFRLVMAGQYIEASEKLDLYLPSFPYQDNPILHIYAGLLRVYAAQPQEDHPNEAPVSFDTISLRDAQSHFERARALDVDNIVANAFLAKIPILMNSQQTIVDPDSDEGDPALIARSTSPPQKRARTELPA
ncbi:hypothetical protein HWV62_7916 [Athelia sp. TMB]|nr:hypothetical protein HWV62_7916 [Athelia sp. TMB]